jgi:hypothetical protein
METNENTFDAENPWITVSLEDVKDYENGEWEIFYRPEGKDYVKVRKVL